MVTKMMATMAADPLGQLLAEDIRRLFGSSHQEHAQRTDAIARVALECVDRSGALYHTLEHTLLVTSTRIPHLKPVGAQQDPGKADKNAESYFRPPFRRAFPGSPP